MRIEIKDDQITIGLEALQRSLTNMKPVMEEIGEYAVESTKKRFKEGKSPDGSTWKAKSQATLDAYARKRNKVDTRPLFGPSSDLSEQLFAYPADDSVEWGSSKIYAAMMQFGGTKSAFPHLWGDIPARPFLGISEDDRTNILGIMEEWLGRTWAQKG